MTRPRIAAIVDVCHAHFGVYRRGKWTTPNRCDSCPLREPCVEHGRTPGTSFEQLDASRDTFEAAALAILATRAA